MSKNINGCFYGRQTPTKYEIKKEEARQLAIDWQLNAIDQNLYMSELADAGTFFTKLAKRYGLLREFKENGII